MNKIDIKSMYLEELQSFVEEKGLPKFRAKQIYEFIKNGVTDFDEMTNLAKSLREELKKTSFIANCDIEIKRESKLDETVKYLFKLFDGEYIESVLMKYKHGNTICISTQVGCKMGCTFCATGKQGFTRNLLPSEMLSQIHAVQKDSGERISNIVLMGMGEPLDNYDNVLKFLRLVSSDDNLNIGMRHISLSTCGIVPKIYDLAEQKLQLTLSVSLHATSDEIRNLTMPVNKRYNIEKLIESLRYYGKVTGRRISIEYAMIKGYNDSPIHAKELLKKLKGILCHINLIPVNDVTGSSYKKSSMDSINAFSHILEKNGFTATVRRTLGQDIEASCGQLKGNKIRKEHASENIFKNGQRPS